MIKDQQKNSEYLHFQKLSKSWWNPKGKFKILHTLTPIRITYIKEIIGIKNPKFIDKKKPLTNIEILDLGCGGGLICEPLSRLGAKVTGLDFVKDNINIAKKHSKESKLNIKYIHQNINKLYLSKKYDVILLLEVLEHIENWQSIIIKIKKYLKPKGKLIISTINKNLFSKLLVIDIGENILKWVPKKTHNYRMFIQPEELENFLQNNKFNIIDFTGLKFNPLFYEWNLNKKNMSVNYFCSAEKTN